MPSLQKMDISIRIRVRGRVKNTPYNRAKSRNLKEVIMLSEKMNEKVENIKTKIKENKNKIIGGIALAGAAVGAVALGLIALSRGVDIVDDEAEFLEVEEYDVVEDDSDDEDEDEDDED